jgi:putative solute:sodium symporter small subunit
MSGDRPAGRSSGERPPARVRVAASDARRPLRTATRGIALPGSPTDEADAVFSRGLVRAQLRLALACLLGFLVVAGALTAVLFVLPVVADPVLFGVPLSWLLHAYGFYPIILAFAVVYARGASRNERRYRVLVEPGHES